VTGASTTCTELDAGSPSPAAVTADRPHRKPSGDWSRHAGSHRSVKPFWMWWGTNVLLGRPCRQGAGPHSGRCLILMGVWRDPSYGRSHQPKKRARFEHGSWKKRMKEIGSWRCQKKLVLPLTTGRLMGVTVTRKTSPRDCCRAGWRARLIRQEIASKSRHRPAPQEIVWRFAWLLPATSSDAHACARAAPRSGRHDCSAARPQWTSMPSQWPCAADQRAQYCRGPPQFGW
jgi:hypothetical protein